MYAIRSYYEIDMIKHVILIYEDNIVIGCGAIKRFDDFTMEVKRMFVLPGKRGKGVAALVLDELEKWAKELHYKKCILETGKKQPEAIRLYTKHNYLQIPNYGQYDRITSYNVCYTKLLRITASQCCFTSCLQY